MNNKLQLLDSTLRDGAQGENISFSVEDKLHITMSLDKLGIDYIEAGNPYSNPKDAQFFERMSLIKLTHARLSAFGSTRRMDTPVEQDKNCQALLWAETPAVSLFGKSWDVHVTRVLRTTLDENLRMIADTVRFFAEYGKEVLFDAEHFFDGYQANPDYALKTVQTALAAGAACIVLCDTNGGTFPDTIYDITKKIADTLSVRLGIHTHDDMGCAVANTLMAVKAGVTHVQGTYVGFGERCGNANLSAIIPSLQLKRGYDCIPPDRMSRLTETAHYISEISNCVLPGGMPYVGKGAFSHKGGMHVDGVRKLPRSFEHIDPAIVGNSRNILLSEVSGRTAIIAKLQELDPTLTKEDPTTARIVERLKQLECEGYQYEAAAASFELVVLRQLNRVSRFFEVEMFRVIGEQSTNNNYNLASAMIKVKVGDNFEFTADEGEGPVNALDKSLKKALIVFYPTISQVRLIDYKVRVMDSARATASTVRVFIVSTDGKHIWTTVGVSTDIINASIHALIDSIEYKLYTDQQGNLQLEA